MTENLISAAREQAAALTRSAYEKAAAAGALPAGADIKAQVAIPKDTKNGDYATSFALAAAKALGKAPRDIAQALMDHVEKVDPKAFVTVYAVGSVSYQPKPRDAK